LEQALIISFSLSDSSFGSAWEHELLACLGRELFEAVSESEAGEFDGHDVGEGQHTLFLYGFDADRLYEVAAPILSAQPWPNVVTVIKRFGPPGAPETRIVVQGRA
jgi:hypothetical protein